MTTNFRVLDVFEIAGLLDIVAAYCAYLKPEIFRRVKELRDLVCKDLSLSPQELVDSVDSESVKAAQILATAYADPGYSYFNGWHIIEAAIKLIHERCRVSNAVLSDDASKLLANLAKLPAPNDKFRQALEGINSHIQHLARSPALERDLLTEEEDDADSFFRDAIVALCADGRADDFIPSLTIQ